MKLKIIVNFLFLIGVVLFLYSCSSSKEVSNQNADSTTDSVYVFDQVPVSKDTVVLEQPKVSPPQINVKYHIVQIGAFTTMEKAVEFADMAKKVLKYTIEISYSSNINLYVVQLTPPYSTKADAEQVRDELWKMEIFKDAWILTVTK